MKLSLASVLPGVDRGWKSMYSVCSLQTCRNTLLMRSIQSRVGIRVDQQWYCSVDCFATAARKRFSMLLGASILEMPHHPRLSIGLVMLSKGYLTDDQLRFAMAESRLHGEELEAVLVRHGLASERQLTAARAAQWGYPILGQDRMGQPVEADIPPALLHALHGGAVALFHGSQAVPPGLCLSRGTQPSQFPGTDHGLQGRPMLHHRDRVPRANGAPDHRSGLRGGGL